MNRIDVTSTAPTASADRLWSLVGDLLAWGEMLPTVTSVRRYGGEEGPITIGSRFDVRQPGLPLAVYEITEWSPGRSFTWVARSPGVVSTAGHVVEPHRAGARLSLSLDWTGPLAGPVRLLIGPKARRMVQTEAATFVRLAEGG